MQETSHVPGLGERVHHLRVQRGLSQSALAAGCISPSYLSLIEAGKRMPGEAVVRELAQRLDTTPERLLGTSDATAVWYEARLHSARYLLESGRSAEALTTAELIATSNDAPMHLVDEAVLLCARSLEHSSQLEAAVMRLRPLHDRATTGSASVTVTMTGITLVRCLIEAGDLHHAIDVGQAALVAATAQGLDGTDDQVRLVATVMGAHLERGDLLHADEMAHEILSSVDVRISPQGRGSLHWNAALVAQERGRPELALHHLRSASAYLDDGSASRTVLLLRLTSAEVFLRLTPPQPGEAQDLLTEIAAPLQQLGSAVDLAYWHDASSRSALLHHRYDEAEAHARHALEKLGTAPRIEACRARIALGDALSGQQRDAEALTHYQRAADHLAMMSASRQAASLWRDIAERLRSAGAAEAAMDAFAQSLDNAGCRARLPVADLVGLR